MNKKKERNLLEKITFFVGIVTVIILIGYLTFEMYKNKNQPPDLVVSYQQERNSREIKYRVEVENKGEETAEAAIIQFDFYDNGKVSAKAELQIDYVPIRSKEIGWIVFPGQEKAPDSLVVNSVGYIQP